MRKSALLTLLFFFLSAVAFAQSAAGVAGISGVVRDPSGAVVPNAKVEISSGQGTVRSLTSNDAGLFAAPGLKPGPGYQVSVTVSGFAAYEAKDMILQVGQTLDLKVNLKVASTATSVEVAGAAPLVETTKTDVSGVVDQRSIVELPINGRRVDTFVLLQPGVSNDGFYGLLSFRGVAGQNAFLVDGNDTTEQFYNENAGRTRITSQISQDAVQEFQVVSANYSPQYGHAMGGVINTVTKSGDNEFHGTAYYFFRSTMFDARDPFSPVISDRRVQDGGSIGGPILRNKLFFFLNADITQRNYPISSSLNTNAVDPTTQTWKLCGTSTGSLTTGIYVPAATAAQCAAINGLLPRFFGQVPRKLSQQLAFGKLDYHASARSSFSATLNFLHETSPNGIQSAISLTNGSAITGNGDDAVTVRNGGVAWTFVPKSNLVNEARIGFATDRQSDTFDNSLLGGGLGFLQASVNGTSLGQANYLPRIQPAEKRLEFQDNVSWMKGAHSIKFGVDVATTNDWSSYLTNAFGSYTYQTVNAFALDYAGASKPCTYTDPSSKLQTPVSCWQTFAQTFGNPVVDATINDYAFYLQDQWRATSKLTVTYGARYEYAQLPQPTVCNQDYQLTCHIHSKPTNIMPRVGLAYAINDKTVLQAGYGMFYSRFQGGTIQSLFSSGNGVAQKSVSLSSSQSAQLFAGPTFPSPLTTAPTVNGASALSLQMLDPNIKTPYSEQANIGIQRQLPWQTALTVSYIWSRGVQLYGIRDLNLPSTTTNYTYTINDANNTAVGTYTTPVLTGTRPDTRYGQISYGENGVNSYYNGLAVMVNKRFDHGLQLLGSYTWSHEIDDGQSYGESTNNLWLSSPTYWLGNGNYAGDKGNGTLDQRHRASLSWVWAPTFMHSQSAIAKYLVNGWQLSSITTMGSGHPYGSVQAYLNDKPVTGMFGYSLNGTGFSYRVPWQPVNGYMYPATYRSDARLSKSIAVSEKDRLVLNLECFNLSNSWFATGYTNSRMYNETKGVLTPAALYVPSAAYGSPDGTQARRYQISARFTF